MIKFTNNHEMFLKRYLQNKDENGELVINEKEAEIERRIFREYLEGKNYQAIANGCLCQRMRTDGWERARTI